ncbi:RNA 3'-terminal phosphate cyclase [Haloplanus aerogenes]|uniref:RNA 3'-terminal phosphate cyclase n=1 Tax=Haloplanus aerogenes TaxID=660522 RepID=A0A3G8QSP8_9EURY|nr:RNA 3'-terminal phosphate cyclase [Haloplanus aerogenes]AZH25370.1 RNA 3'-terminal phosphate cyclase [Haloplanus aerogenes]RMB25072.1 RNA 3'-terminal phosphate cyclase (ATP) [Haloplanus aerogenes]
MLELDGADGGGQLLRTALSLAVVTDTPFRIESIRNDRPNPGLAAQHLAAVQLAASYCDAEVEGAELGADTVTFVPGSERRSPLEAHVDTAGSVTLLCDTLLPVAAVDDDPVQLTATGGTDVKWAPTAAYYRRVKLPLLATQGLDADLTVDRTGFYPAGGGEVTLTVASSSLSRFDIDDRGDLERVDVYSKAAADLADREVADRQATQAAERLDEMGVPADVARVDYVEAESLGSSLLLRATYDHTVAGFSALGERGRTSEDVADEAVDAFESFRAGTAPVDEHMADQLLVLLAFAGGRIRIPRLTDHVRTNLELVGAFGSDIEATPQPDGTYRVRASRIRPFGEDH